MHTCVQHACLCVCVHAPVPVWELLRAGPRSAWESGVGTRLFCFNLQSQPSILISCTLLPLKADLKSERQAQGLARSEWVLHEATVAEGQCWRGDLAGSGQETALPGKTAPGIRVTWNQTLPPLGLISSSVK